MSKYAYQKLIDEAVFQLKCCLSLCTQLLNIPISETPLIEGDYVLVKTDEGCFLKAYTPIGVVTLSFHDNFNALNIALPQPGQPVDAIVAVRNSQGISWLPGPLGGTWYPKGYYRSTGVAWEFFGDFSYQATLAAVDAGFINDQFVTPFTFEHAAKWNTKHAAIQFEDEGVNLGTAGTVDEIDFTGNVAATRVGDKLIINIPNTSASSEAIINQYTAGEALNGGRAVYMNADGKVYHLDITDPATYLLYVGISSQAAIANDPVNVVCQGKTQVLGSGWIAGQRYWIGATGFLATSAPGVVGLNKSVAIGIDVDTINIINFTETILI